MNSQINQKTELNGHRLYLFCCYTSAHGSSLSAFEASKRCWNKISLGAAAKHLRRTASRGKC